MDTTDAMDAKEAEDSGPATVNGVPLHAPGRPPDAAELRQRACTELLRQAALRSGLLDAADRVEGDGIVSEAAGAAIEALLERELVLPDPDEAACRRHHAAHAARYAQGERVQARHVLFAVTPGVDVNALRRRAEACLVDLRCRPEAFADVARELSNCPSGADGGALGRLEAHDCAPEFARELFGHSEVGVLPRLVSTRFGWHVVEVLAREPGRPQPFESVHEAVSQVLRRQAWATALRQYLQLLAAAAVVRGVTLETADSPLVQ
ncbi:MAG TPA: peptidylprolyl isomerase [Rubrivivax sp.]|nr:peptidylprolyl isomerase [Rubrivivax sp.]HPP83778.1 peptidylprolyl isomerase [Rubrivivax sp.]